MVIRAVGRPGVCCCVVANTGGGCSLTEVPTIHPTECNETMDSVGGFTSVSNPAPLFTGSMQSPIIGGAQARKDMSIDLLTFTTLEIRHSSFVSEETQLITLDAIQSRARVAFSDNSDNLNYLVSHANNRFILSPIGGPSYSYFFTFGGGAITSPNGGGLVFNAETESDFRARVAVGSRTFEEDQFGQCVMNLEGMMEFFINGELEQSTTFSTVFNQSQLNFITNSYILEPSVNSATTPTDQGINSIQVTVT